MTNKSILQLDNYFHYNSGHHRFVFEGDNSTDIHLMSANGYISAAVVLCFIGVLGFVFNLIVILIMVCEKILDTPFNIILFNLVCSDFSVSVIGNPLTFISAVHRKWVFGRTICILYGFFMALAGIASIVTITVLGLDRCLNISKPFHSRAFTVKHAKRTVCGIWIYSLFVTLPPLMGWGEYINESANISCSVNWGQRNLKTTTYILFLFTMGLLLPVIVICFSYCKIIAIIQKRKLSHGRIRRAEIRVIIMIAVMVAVFLLAWTPYAVVALIVAFGNPDIVSPAVSVIPALIAKSSICYNPIIYAGLNYQIRAAGFKLFGFNSWRGKSTVTKHCKFDNLSMHTEDLFIRAGTNKSFVEHMKRENVGLGEAELADYETET